MAMHRTQHGVQAEVNITPLVDVMLVLLVIFMVTAPALATRLDSRLPQAGRPPQVEARQVVVEINAAGLWSVDGRAMSRAEAGHHLQALAREAPQPIALVRASADADYQQFVDALAMTRSSGFQDISTPSQ